MNLWHLLLLVILFIGTAFTADLEGSGSGDNVVEEGVLKAQNLLNAVQSDGSGAEVEASGEDVQTFFF
ncbi:hypothetical protein GCK72_014329 [Caenorhabditis remanei]|uniref:Secreted protein n=1 Tax=Caenorhabditis remanei TaxID=31234 RepID=E3MM90_CAERE|nr:hypothetical protein GCK72_014329 [Caenorhabditis remanei]EFP04783.1 hypothetical protein CRE_29932 [Caenorhabditis remanei]KAF1757872.1 hypothetical protein GCK72_014329 [Caenorhabditis remanei]